MLARLLASAVLLTGCGSKKEDRPAEPPVETGSAVARPAPKPSTSPKLDLDGNGRVDDGERVASRKVRLSKTLSLLDTNGDSKVTLAELEQTKLPYLKFADPKAVDTDANGTISVEEVDAALDDRRTKSRERWERKLQR